MVGNVIVKQSLTRSAVQALSVNEPACRQPFQEEGLRMNSAIYISTRPLRQEAWRGLLGGVSVLQETGLIGPVSVYKLLL